MINYIKSLINRKRAEKNCSHVFGKVDKGYQYCEKCGIAILAPEFVCKQHKLVLLDKYQRSMWGQPKSVIYVSRCVNCGEIVTKSTDDYKNEYYQ